VIADVPPWADAWCQRVLGSEAATLLFSVSHLSEVVGVRLADEREIVVKRRFDASRRTRTCVTAQRLLAEQGFPCPMPVTDVIFDGDIAVHAERFVGGGEVLTEVTAEVAARSAELLADLIRLASTFDLEPPLPNPQWVRWDALPERQAKAALPAWIEETTTRVHARLAECELPPTLGHADWEAQNMHWQHGETLAVHDWDSLAWLPEAALAGTAAGVFATHGMPVLAPLESSEAFLDAYQRARRAPFSEHETEIAWAASIWVALQNVRDELIYDRPRLSFDGLKAQRAERLGRANA
jgi:hypothetical protein